MDLLKFVLKKGWSSVRTHEQIRFYCNTDTEENNVLLIELRFSMNKMFVHFYTTFLYIAKSNVCVFACAVLMHFSKIHYVRGFSTLLYCMLFEGLLLTFFITIRPTKSKLSQQFGI